MHTIKNLNQIKGGVASIYDQTSPEVLAEIQRLFDEDRATYLLLYGDLSVTTAITTEDFFS